MRGRCAAARLSVSLIPWKWYKGSFSKYGFQTTSSEKTTLPSTTAAHLRSEPPRSKPMRQPSRWRPRGWEVSRAGGSFPRTAFTSIVCPNMRRPTRSQSKDRRPFSP